MRLFKVIALSCSGKGKKIYSAGDIIDESGFPDGSVDGLIKGKFITEIQEENKSSDKGKVTGKKSEKK